MTVPYIRPRRLRDSAILRDAIAETTLGPQNLMLPMFVADIREDREITGMPGVFQRSVESLAREVASAVEAGVRSFILFGVPDQKDPRASSSRRDDGVVPRAIRAIKKEAGDAAFVCTDVCVCSYTDHGHCGIVEGGRLDNDASIEVIAEMALAHASAGADMVAPSDMMDGRVRRIRERLDAAGLSRVPIMSYAVKYASSLYGPFRHAADSAPKFGDRKTYQMDFRNAKDARREAQLDVAEGADLVMVKPGLAYLDILRDLAGTVDVPLAAYQVSGEYAMIKYAAQAGAIDEASVVRELWYSFRRAGASLILTYHAVEAVRRGWITK